MSRFKLLAACLLLQLGLLPVAWNLYSVGDFNDDASYLALARSLARGLPYQDLFQVGAPAQVRFPPGYAVLLAPFQASLTLARLESYVFALAALAVFYLYSRRWSVWPAVLLAANAVWAYSGASVMSESAFCLAILLYIRHLDGLGEGKPRQIFILGMGAALCYYLRAVGLLLVPATLLWRRRRNWRGHLLFLLGFGLSAGPHALSKILTGYDGEFAGQRVSLWQTCRTNLSFMPTNFGAALTGGLPADLRPLFWVLFALSLLGLCRRRKETAASAWTACYLAAMVGWPFHQTRFVIPILPFMLLGLSTLFPRRHWLTLVLVGELTAAAVLYHPARPSPAAELHELAGKLPPGGQLAADTMDLGIYENIPAFGRPASEIVERDWDWEQALLDNRIGLVVVVRAQAEVKAIYARRPALYRLVHDSPNYTGYVFLPRPRALLLHSAARAAMAQERYPCAERLFRSALESDPEHSTLHSGLAYALAHQQRLPEARWEVGQALKLAPDNGEALTLDRFLKSQP